MTTDPAIFRAWRVVHGFVAATGICVCGTLMDALQHLHEALGCFPAWLEPAIPGPTDPGELFIAYVLDSWGLITHHGSLGAGVVRTERGDALYAAMQVLVDAGEPLLIDQERDVMPEWQYPTGEQWWEPEGRGS